VPRATSPFSLHVGFSHGAPDPIDEVSIAALLADAAHWDLELVIVPERLGCGFWLYLISF
jgi:hypothetical protein